MRTKIIMLLVVCSLFAGKVNAQWVVSDPGNLAQGIINASKNIVQTSSCLLYTSDAADEL